MWRVDELPAVTRPVHHPDPSAASVGLERHTKRPSGALDQAGLNRPDAPVLVQSFGTTDLRRLRAELRVPLVQLLSADGAPADWSPLATRAATPT